MSKTSQTNGDQTTRAYVAAGIADMLELSMQVIEKAGFTDQLRDVLCALETARQRLASAASSPGAGAPQQIAPDFGTPWPPRAGEGYCYLEPDRYERAAACVNACAGMGDPAVEIQALRKAREELENWKSSGIHSCHADCKRPLCVANRKIKAMHEAISEAAPLVECLRGGHRHPQAEAAPAKLQPLVEPRSRLKLASVTIEPSNAQRVDLEPLRMDEPPAWPVLAPQLVAHPTTAERDEVRNELDQLSRDLSSLLAKDCLDGHDAVEGRSNGIALRAAVRSMQAAIESAYTELVYAAGLSAVNVMKNNIAAGMSALRPFVRSNDPQKPTAEREEVLINKPLLAALRALVEPSKELVGLPLIGDLATRNSAVYAKWKAVQAALVNIKKQVQSAGESPVAVNNHA